MSKPFSNLPQLFSDAYKWLCKRRKNHPPDSDIWNFKCTWHSQAEAIMESFKFGSYQFDVQAKITLSCGETIALWSSRDALIIKVFSRIGHNTKEYDHACYDESYCENFSCLGHGMDIAIADGGNGDQIKIKGVHKG